ncbi:hypothetical protein RMATCC62417_04560 [Rhizopus microsporus]|nr:hypothetical protein RMATCC62417_04560 [Rhizopus microsporus]
MDCLGPYSAAVSPLLLPTIQHLHVSDAVESGVHSPPLGESSSLLKMVFPRHLGMQHLIVKDVYTYQASNNTLRPRAVEELHRHTFLSKIFVKAVCRRQIQLLSSLCHPLRANTSDLSSSDATMDLKTLITPTDRFQQFAKHPVKLRAYLCHSLFPPQPLPTSVPARRWLYFWKLHLPLAAYMVWFRLLHRKVSCLQPLHRLIPDIFPSYLCFLCSGAEDTIQHFFFEYPLKEPVWSFLLRKYAPQFICLPRPHPGP